MCGQIKGYIALQPGYYPDIAWEQGCLDIAWDNLSFDLHLDLSVVATEISNLIVKVATFICGIVLMLYVITITQNVIIFTVAYIYERSPLQVSFSMHINFEE